MRRLQFLASGPARSFVAEAHAKASAIFRDELDAGLFEGIRYRQHRIF
jgi:hypothetical protein